jgi:cell division septal protein FtsQ
MKKRLTIATLLFILLTTITSQKKIFIDNFNLRKIEIENNFLLKDNDIKKSLKSIYNKNLLTLNYKEIEQVLMQNSFIDSFDVKKKYPETLKIKVFERKPIAILLNKKKKFYLSEKIDLIEFKDLEDYKNLPYVFGDKDKFQSLYQDLERINFPFNLIKNYIYFESSRWDLKTINKKTIKLPEKNYIKSLQNYLIIYNKDSFAKYTTFDYRIEDQLVLK